MNDRRRLDTPAPETAGTSAGRPPLMVATDLDGCLLDEATYSFAPARPALAGLVDHGATLTLASSKTRAELLPLAEAIGSTGPLIAENGAVLLLPRAGGGYRTRASGVPREALVRALGEIATEIGHPLRGFSMLDAAAVSELTGLDLPAASLALEREYDEPFVLSNRALADRVARAARQRGLRVTLGGRFFHLTGPSDKGTALREVLALLGPRDWRTIGLGDAANDLPLLRAVDRAIVIPGPDGTVRRELRAALPTAERAPHPGPRGWNAAVLAVLEGRRLPGVVEAWP